MSLASLTERATAIYKKLFPQPPGSSPDDPMTVTAVPGLTTLLDVALYRAVEGQLTATTCSSHALLWAWIDVQKESQQLIQLLSEASNPQDHKHFPTMKSAESFARQCLEAAKDALERMATENLAQTANLSDPYDSSAGGASHSAGGHHHGGSSMLSSVGFQEIESAILAGSADTGRRIPIQSRRDCWESPRLMCCDYVWADDVFQACQRSLRSLGKHPFVIGNDTAIDSIVVPSSRSASLPPMCDRSASLLLQLIQDDIPTRVWQFKKAIDAESVVTKRLYLVKCEYRAPFRAFCEAHQSVQRAPSLQMVQSKNLPSKEACKAKLQKLLGTEELKRSLAYEKECERLEVEMGKALFPFSELARFLDSKKAHVKVVSGKVRPQDLPVLQETVRRLKLILCRKGATETSPGIRPILLDLQGLSRDDEPPVSPWSLQALLHGTTPSSLTVNQRLDEFVRQLKMLRMLCFTRNGFASEKKLSESDIPPSISKGCDEFDSRLFSCQFQDWFTMVNKQHELLQNKDFAALADEIRRAELELSIAGAAKSLDVVQQRLEMLALDRKKKFEILKEMVEEVCLREMNLYVKVVAPAPERTLLLSDTTALGFLGLPLIMAGESLPIG
jgi:hypothetical protein